jgi:hypothetical protein
MMKICDARALTMAGAPSGAARAPAIRAVARRRLILGMAILLKVVLACLEPTD